MNNDSLKDDSQLPEQQGSGDRRPGLQTSCDWLAKQLVLTPRDLGSRMALGLALGDLGDHEGARNQFELADGTKPDNVRILVNLAMSCLQCGRTVGFEAALSRALACAGDDAELQRLLARMNLQSGSVAAARQGFERLLQHTPTDPDALTGLAKCYLAAGDPENASAVMGRLVGQASESSGSGSSYGTLKNTPKAILIYSHFHKNYPYVESKWYQPTSHTGSFQTPRCRLIEMPKDGPLAVPEGIRLDQFESCIHASLSKEAEYVGVTTYRRYPLFVNQHKHPNPKYLMDPTESNLSFLVGKEQEQAALDMLKTYEVIQFRPYVLAENYREQWGCFHNPKAFDIFIEELGDTELAASVSFFDHSNAHVWGPLMIAKWELVAEFTHFYMALVKRLVSRDDFAELLTKGEDKRWANFRIPGFLGERLVPLWVFHKRLKSGFVPTVVTEKDA